MIAAVKDLGVPVPIVIRMEGTNVELGKQMLTESGLNFTTADTMSEAADEGRRAGEVARSGDLPPRELRRPRSLAASAGRT